MSSQLEDDLYGQILALGLPQPEREHMFAKSIKRRWRFDLAWPELKLAAEIDGGTWVQGRHSRGAGVRKDCEKMNTAIVDFGWQVLRFDSTMVRDGTAALLLLRALRRETA